MTVPAGPPSMPLPGPRPPGARDLPVRTGRGIDRSGDRTVSVAGLAIAAAYLLAAGIALAIGGGAGPWLPLHLALAGGASVAIAAMLPFFAAALVAAPPAPTRQRAAAVGLVAAGAAIVTLGVTGGDARLGAAGGAVHLAGMALLVTLTLRILRGTLIARRRIFGILYGVAIGCVLAGVTLSTLMLAGVPAVAGAWPTLRAAHAWLNLFGFVGLVVAATLIHFLPTVVGSRIEQGRGTVAGILLAAAGPPTIAAGFIVGAWPVIVVGAILVAAGAAWLIGYALDVLRRRARWTTDPGWHRFTTGSLSAAIGWLVLAQVGAAAVAVARGPGPAGWVGGVIVLPLVLGAIAQAIVGSWSHLLPAIGPGGPVRHAWQRRMLGRWSGVRLITLQLGVVTLLVTAIAGAGGIAEAAGRLLVTASMAVSIGLLAAAFLGGRMQGGTG